MAGIDAHYGEEEPLQCDLNESEHILDTNTTTLYRSTTTIGHQQRQAKRRIITL